MSQPYGESIGGRIRSFVDHFHAQQFVRPTGAAGVTLTTAAGAWALGSIVEVIAASDITTQYDIHFANIEAASDTHTYEIVFYTGAGGSEVEWGRTRFTKSAQLDTQHGLKIQGEPIDANARLSAACMSSGGGSATCVVSVEGHPY